MGWGSFPLVGELEGIGHGGGHKEGDYEALHPGFGERKY